MKNIVTGKVIVADVVAYTGSERTLASNGITFGLHEINQRSHALHVEVSRLGFK